jgi:hypothetical protein
MRTVGHQRGSKPLDRRERYRNKARQCAAAAGALRQITERVAVLQLAQSWMKLADHAGEAGAHALDNSQQLFGGIDAATAPRTPKMP